MNKELVTALTQFQAVLNKVISKIDNSGDEAQAKTKEKIPKSQAKPATPKAKRPIAPNIVKDFITWFITSKEEDLYAVKRGQWECILGEKDEGEMLAHTLVFHSRLLGRRSDETDGSDIICIRPIGAEAVIFNASRITYGRSWSAQKAPQEIAEAAGAVPIPFQNVMSKEAGAGLDLSRLEIVDWSGPEKMIIPPINARSRWGSSTFDVTERHFAGAAVVKVEDSYFLFDTDREELNYHRFNPFFTQLPCAVTSIAEAYDVLMPDEVHQAIADGKEVTRQGEFFFVPVDDLMVSTRIVTNQPEDLFYNDLKARLVEAGASVKNCADAADLTQALRFSDLCNDNNAGTIPGSKIKVEAAIGAYLKKLRQQTGPESTRFTQGEYTKLSKDRLSSVNGGTHSSVLLQHIDSELSNRLTNPASDEPTEMGIYYQAVLGESDGARRGRHVATGAYIPEEGEVYVIGSVIHQGREHRTVFLDEWHRTYANTAVANWTVSGDVD